MAHDETRPDHEGSRRDAPRASRDLVSFPPAIPRAGSGTLLDDPVSWAIAELQDDLEPGRLEPGVPSRDRAALANPDPGPTPDPVPPRSEARRPWSTPAVVMVFATLGALTVLVLHGSRRSRPGPTPPAATSIAASAVASNGSATGRSQTADDPRPGLGALAGRLNASPAEPTTDLDDLEAELGRPAEASGDLAPLAGGIERIDGLSTILKTLTDGVAILREDAETPAPSTSAPDPPSPTSAVEHPGTAPRVEVEVEAATVAEPGEPDELSRALKLFRQNRFGETMALLNRLEATTPDDARVWYFAALCRGHTTGQLGGLTERLVEKGLERERAGTPGRAVIEAAINDLTIEQGGDWLAQHRRRLAAGPKAASATPSRNGR